MNCRQINKWLPLYVSGDLDAPRLEEIEHHLAECLPCHREFQSYRRSLESLKGLGLNGMGEKPDLSLVLDGFTDEIMDRIERNEGGAVAPVPRVTYSVFSRFSGSYLPRSLAAAALVLVLISAGIYLLRPGAGTTEPGFGTPATDFVRKSAPAGQPAMNVLDERPEAMEPFLVSGPFTAVDPAARASQEDPSAGEEMDEPYLDPLPHRFPRVQPVEYKRDF